MGAAGQPAPGPNQPLNGAPASGIGAVPPPPPAAEPNAGSLPANGINNPPGQALPGGGTGAEVSNPAGRVLPGGGTGEPVSNPAGSVLRGGGPGATPAAGAP
jgi:hypothetical protein